MSGGAARPFHGLLVAAPSARADLQKQCDAAADKMETMYAAAAANAAAAGPYFLGERFSIADLSVCSILHRFRFALKRFRGYDLLAGRPRLTALCDAYAQRYSVRTSGIDEATILHWYAPVAAEGDVVEPGQPKKAD